MEETNRLIKHVSRVWLEGSVIEFPWSSAVWNSSQDSLC